MDDSSLFMHEIKNSLNNICLISDILIKETKSFIDNKNDCTDVECFNKKEYAKNTIAEITKYIYLIKSCTNKVKSLEKDYTDFQKLGVFNIILNTVDIKKLVTEIIEEHKLQIEEKNIVIDMDVKTYYPITDPNKLKQVITNIISNSIKYNKTEGSVYIRCRKILNNYILSVVDTGIGMSQDELDKIGMPFYRVKKIETDGTGLGITLIKKIVDLMQWKLNISSKIGVGTHISLIF